MELSQFDFETSYCAQLTNSVFPVVLGKGEGFSTYYLYLLVLGTAFMWERERPHPWLQPHPELPLPKLRGPELG